MADKSNQVRGVDLLNTPYLNKGTAFSTEERAALGLRGLIPGRQVHIEEQHERVYENYGYKPTDLAKYIYLIGLQDRNETLFYYLLERHLDEMMPIVYTPTVGLACQKYSRIFRRPRGLVISSDDKGKVDEILGNWPSQDIRIIVVTDGERILGLGDLGLNGMGIPVGKLSLYVAAAGIDPRHTLPICIDVGTNNDELRGDPLYLGVAEPRKRGAEYDELIDEFVTSTQKRWPNAIIQFEDFGNANAFRLLEKYQDTGPVFNDDMQGTGSVAFAGLLGALRITEESLADQRIVFLGAGEAAIGIAKAIINGMIEAGLTEQDARDRFWLVDSKGLLTTDRIESLAEHKRPFARDVAPAATLLEVVERIKPTSLLGVSGQPGMFSQEVIESVARGVKRPIIFALSNPTSRAECTAQQAYEWTDGRAIFASGSPFDAVTYGGKTYSPGQGNNAYIFPGVGLGVILSGATRIPDSMFHQAAKALAAAVPQEILETGSVYPPLQDIQAVSLIIAAAVAREAYRLKLNTNPIPDDIDLAIRDFIWKPEYLSLL